MKKNKKILIGLICLFVVLLGTTLFVSFSSNVEAQEVIVKSITPVYDETSGVIVDNENVVFNDKNQVVDYKVVIENTQDYDVQITDILLSTPTEEFLDYKVEGIEKNEVLSANSTKELTVSFETMRIDGWGRNFADELTANISFDKYVKQEEVIPPQLEEEKKEDIDKNENGNPDNGSGSTDTEETPKEETPKEEEDSNKEELDTPNKEESSSEKIPNEDELPNKGNISDKDEEESKNEGVVPPNTSDKGLLVILIVATTITGISIIIVSKNKFTKYSVLVMLLSSTLTITKAEVLMELPLTFNINFESQNIMRTAFTNANKPKETFRDYWEHREKIKNFYIQNEIKEISEYAYKFDVTEAQNNRVIAYLVTNQENSDYYDLYLQADGIIYPNENASHYFFDMKELNLIDNMNGIDSSNVTNMWAMFASTGYNSTNFTLDVSNFDTSNVTNMQSIFYQTGYSSETFTLDLSNFDTSNVTNMSYMFSNTGYSNPNFTLDVSNFDTSNVTDMSRMFYYTGGNSETFTLDVSNFDTSNVTNMGHMFNSTGYNSDAFTLDVSNFDTSNVTNMSGMFSGTGYSSENFTLDVSNFDTSNVTNMTSMFFSTGYNSKTFTLDVSDFDTSNVTNMSKMFSGTGYNSKTFTLDVSNFDTSNVTNMTWMFNGTGYNSKTFTLDVSNFDTSNVTNMYGMFRETGYSSETFTLDVSGFDTSNVTDMSLMFEGTGYNSKSLTLDFSSFNTSKVTSMRAMFRNTGRNSETFNLDLSNFDTSNITDMINMFAGTGCNSTKLNTSITIRNPNLTNYSWMFVDAVLKDGSQIKVNYTSETEELVDKMIATKSTNSNVVKGNLIVDVDNLAIGDEIHISGEKFNIISQTDDTVTMLAQYNLGTDYKQNATSNNVKFARYSFWVDSGLRDIDIQRTDWSIYPREYVNGYIEYLKEITDDESLAGDLIALKDLTSLGCDIPTDYSINSGGTCKNSPHKEWLANNQQWWIRSYSSHHAAYVWSVGTDGGLRAEHYNTPFSSVRPTITISKEMLRNLDKI